jgi:hypothetical protein
MTITEGGWHAVKTKHMTAVMTAVGPAKGFLCDSDLNLAPRELRGIITLPQNPMRNF